MLDAIRILEIDSSSDLFRHRIVMTVRGSNSYHITRIELSVGSLGNRHGENVSSPSITHNLRNSICGQYTMFIAQ